MSTISSRLKEERERLGLTQPAFAEAAGAGKRTLIEWEKGTTSPSVVQLSALSSIGVDVYYVLSGIHNLFLDTQQPEKGKLSRNKHLPSNDQSKVSESFSTAPDGFILVPHYEVQASAGHGSLVHSEQIVDYLAFKADWVRNTLGVTQKDLALISVN